MLSNAQFGKLTPVVTAAWAHHCAQRGIDPSKKKANGYRDWYEQIIFDAIHKSSTADIRSASEFGKVLLEFAQVSGDEAVIRDLAADEEHRNRYVLRMMAVDLSFLRCEVTDWEYIRLIYGQSKLPPGEFEDCPASVLLKVIAMIDIQIQRECTRYGISKHHLPRRACASIAKLPHHKAAKIEEKMLEAIRLVAIANGHQINKLCGWHDKLLAAAEDELQARRTDEDQPLELEHSTVTTDATSTQGDIPF